MLTYDRLQDLLSYHDSREYSGRGMMGRQCLSVVTEDGMSPFVLLSQIITGCNDVEEASHLVRYAKTDNMGLDTVIYWPSIKASATAA